MSSGKFNFTDLQRLKHEFGQIKSSTEREECAPALYQVILLNDDYTPDSFVVDILQGIFAMSYSQAVQVMLAAHELGRASCGIYTFDIAETKVEQVRRVATQNQHPLMCALDPIAGEVQ